MRWDNARQLTIEMWVKPPWHTDKVGSMLLSLAVKQAAQQMDNRRVSEIDDVSHTILDDDGEVIGTWELLA